MKKVLNVFFVGMLSLLTNDLFAQQVEMADTMRSDGKIYVIVGIILIVLVGLIGYLLLLDRKITKLERELKNQGK
jgi:CcmD family protein